MIVITLTDCPAALRGDLTKWLLEIAAGVFVGRVSARVRESLWARVKRHIKSGRATMVFHAANEQGLDFKLHNCEREVIDFDGVKLIMKPSPNRILNMNDTRKKGYSKASQYRAAKRSAIRRAYGNKDEPTNAYAVIDVETTGLRPDRSEIFELASIVVINGKITETFSVFIKTEQPIPQKITELTQVTGETVKREGENIETALPRFLEFVGDLSLVGHNVHFDISFIDIACERLGLRGIGNKRIDTLAAARKTIPGLGSYSLSALSEHLDIDLHIHHRALEDCYTTYRLYEKLIKISSGSEDKR